MTCPRCGAEASGRFCSTCGAALGGATCPSCGAALSPGAKFCHACGAVVGAPAGMPGLSPTPRGPTAWVPWAIAGVSVVGLLVVAIVLINRTQSPPPAPQNAAVPSDQMATTDISSMSPREAADRLFDRTMRAAEANDSGQVAFFGPMTIQAYERVEALDADAHYHLGVIDGLLGRPEAALAEADTIQASVPTDLFPSVLRFEVARARNDSAAMRKAAREYLNHYDSEIKAARPGYAAHATLLESYRTQFRELLGKGAG